MRSETNNIYLRSTGFGIRNQEIKQFYTSNLILFHQMCSENALVLEAKFELHFSHFADNKIQKSV